MLLFSIFEGIISLSLLYLHAVSAYFRRFSQFFIAPLFSASCTTRERDAVHSEHQKNISDDEWRREQLLRTLANPSHPFHSFGTGSSETLSGDSIRDGLSKQFAHVL